MGQVILSEFLQLCKSGSPKEVSYYLSKSNNKFLENDSRYITIGIKNAFIYNNLPTLQHLFNRREELNINIFKLYECFSDNIKYSNSQDNFSCIDYVLNNITDHHIKKLHDNLYYCLKTACEYNNIKAIDYLLNQQKIIKLKLSHDNYKYILPIFSHATVEVLDYFFSNANPQHRLHPVVLNNRGLYLAAKADSVNTVEYLIDNNKDFITLDNLNIALIKATIYESTKVVHFLINNYQIEPNNRLEHFLHKNLTQDSFYNVKFIEYVKKLLDNQNLYKKLQKNIHDTSKTELKKKKI